MEIGGATAVRWIGLATAALDSAAPPGVLDAERWTGPEATPVGSPAPPGEADAVRWIGPRSGCEPAPVEAEVGEAVAECSIGLAEVRWIEPVPTCVPPVETGSEPVVAVRWIAPVVAVGWGDAGGSAVGAPEAEVLWGRL